MKRLCSLLFLAVIAGSAGPAPAGLSASIRGLLAQPANRNASWSIHFVDVATGRTVYSYEADEALIPASNMKVVTSAAALKILGADFVFETTFGRLGEDLVVVASGDPTLGDPVLAGAAGANIFAAFAPVAAALRQRGIATITGNLLVDASLFDDVRFHPNWPADQANNWYAAQVAALCFNNNCLDITVRPGASGAPALATFSPSTEYVTVENRSRTITSGQNTIWAARNPNSNHFSLRGNVRTEATFSAAVDQPSAFAGFVLAEYLLSQGISINGQLIVQRVCPEIGRPPAALEVLHVERTPLATALARSNQRSLNLAAECVFKTVAAYGAKPGTIVQGSWPLGSEVVAGFLREMGADLTGHVIDDGSGLSRANRLSARTLTTILTTFYGHPQFGRTFRESLATPDGDGTLARSRRFSEPVYEGRIEAKTGYISGVWALSGYCQQASGRWLAFAVLANRPSGGSLRSTIDDIVKAVMAE